MSLTPSMIDAMLAAGCTAEQIAAVVKASLVDGEAKAAEKRAKDAERQRKSRANRGLSRDVTVTECDERDELLDKEKSPTPPKEINPPSGDKSPSGKPRPRKADDFELPERIPAEPWAEFVTMRRRMGKPLTPRAKQLAVEKLDELATAGWPPGEVLNNSILNSYQGLVPPKENRNGTRNHNPAAGRPTVSDALHTARSRLGYS